MTTGEEVDTSRWPAGTIGATSGSIPLPSPTPQVYQPSPWQAAAAAEIHTTKQITSINNRLDLFKLRLDLADETIRAMLEKDVSDGELLKWFKEKKEQFCKTLSKRTARKMMTR